VTKESADAEPTNHRQPGIVSRWENNTHTHTHTDLSSVSRPRTHTTHTDLSSVKPLLLTVKEAVSERETAERGTAHTPPDQLSHTHTSFTCVCPLGMNVLLQELNALQRESRSESLQAQSRNNADKPD